MKNLIVLAHQDDEAIGISSLVQQQGNSSRFLFITDGMVHPNIDPKPYAPFTRFAYGDDYRVLRRQEALDSLALVGVSPNAVSFGDLPCQMILPYVQHILCVTRNAVSSQIPDRVITHDFEGGNIDHDILCGILNLVCFEKHIPFVRFSEYNFFGSRFNHGLPPFREKQIMQSYTVTPIKDHMFRQYASQEHEIQHFLSQEVETLILGTLSREEMLSYPHEGICAYDRNQKNNYLKAVLPAMVSLYG